MENNKKKALIKSVAAFTFAVSMFAAQSPAASAADVSATDMMGHKIAVGENEEEAEEAETDTTGDGDDDVNTDENAVAGEAAEAVGAEVDEAEAEAPVEENAAETPADETASVEENTDETPADETAPVEENVTETPDDESAPVEDTVVETPADDTAAPVEEAASETPADDTAVETAAEEAAEEAETAAESVRSILGGANGYNVFVEGNYTQTGKNNIDVGDGSGVVAVGGNVDVGEGIDHKGSSFEVGGSVVGTLNGDKVAVGEDCTVDFQNTFNELRQTSSAISQVSGTTVSNGSDSSYIKSEYGTITLKGSDADVNVFNMTVEEYNAMKTSENMALRYDVPDGSTVIFNIVGEGDVNLVFDWGAYYNGGSLTSGNKTGNSKVMINVPGGNNVTIASGVGSLLAPSSSVGGGEGKGYNPHYEGQVICKEFSGNIQFGSSAFDYTIKDKPVTPDTPENPDTSDNTENPETPDETDDNTPDTPDEPDNNNPETPDETDDDTPDTPDESDDNDPETPDETDDDTPDTPNEPDDNDPEIPDETDDDTPDTPDEPDDNDPETPDETDDDTPDTPDVPVTPDIPNVPVTPDVPEIPNFPVSPVTPIIDFEMFDETETPLAGTPFEETVETVSESDTDAVTDTDADADSYETFDDAPVPLADDPFGDTDADSYAVNPKTGVDMTVPMGAAAAAMASFMALMIANKKRRSENS